MTSLGLCALYDRIQSYLNPISILSEPYSKPSKCLSSFVRFLRKKHNSKQDQIGACVAVPLLFASSPNKNSGGGSLGREFDFLVKEAQGGPQPTKQWSCLSFLPILDDTGTKLHIVEA